MPDMIYSAYKTQEYFLWALCEESLEENGVTTFYSQSKNPNLNFAIQTGVFQNSFGSIFHQVESFFKRSPHGWSWMMHSGKDQERLKEDLKTLGFELVSNYPVMVHSLESFDPAFDLKKYQVRKVGSHELMDWLWPLKESFQLRNEDAALYLKAHHQALKKKAHFMHFVAYAKDEPVAAATLSLNSFGARLDDIGTRPLFQRQGFATAVTLYAMKVAKECGYPWVCLEASDEGIPLYTKMGFKELYRNKIYGSKSSKA